MPEPAIKMRQWGNYRPINNGYFTRRKVGQAAQTGSMLIIVTFVFWQLSLPASKQLMLIAVDFGNQVHSANSSHQSIWQSATFSPCYALIGWHDPGWKSEFFILEKSILQFGEIHFAIWTINLAMLLFLLVTLSSASMIQDERSHSTKFRNGFQTLAANTMKGWWSNLTFQEHFPILYPKWTWRVKGCEGWMDFAPFVEIKAIGDHDSWLTPSRLVGGYREWCADSTENLTTYVIS